MVTPRDMSANATVPAWFSATNFPKVAGVPATVMKSASVMENTVQMFQNGADIFKLRDFAVKNTSDVLNASGLAALNGVDSFPEVPSPVPATLNSNDVLEDGFSGPDVGKALSAHRSLLNRGELVGRDGSLAWLRSL